MTDRLAKSFDAPPTVKLRIPGLWNNPQELIDALPPGVKLEPSDNPEENFAFLVLDDGSRFELNALPADDEFAEIFQGSCSHKPSDRDLEIIEHYRVNVYLSGPGGSLEAAAQMLKAGVAILDAGGAGVFVDNSGAAHGSDDWRRLASDPNNAPGGDYGGAFWAFLSTIGGDEEIYSIGMHVLGFRDAVLPRTDDKDADLFMLHNFLGYTYRSGRTIADGDILGDPERPLYRVHKEEIDDVPPNSPFFNPFGRWRLEPIEDGEYKDYTHPSKNPVGS